MTSLMFIGCEGDIGPQGPAGVQGPQGPQGPGGANGQNGQNGAESCLECHGNNQLITAKIFQWENSIHALGGHYERNAASCAGCHTSQGFLDRIATGEMNASADVADPLPQNCYTCHNIHQSYTDADWSLTSQDPVTLWVTGETVDIGKGNQCINCHQARVPSPAIPAPGTAGTFTVTSSRFGPHHGAQGMAFTGKGGFEVGTGYTNSAHTAVITNSCITCHMADVAGGRDAGGHTFRVVSEDGELNTNGCVTCHSNTDALETLVEDTQAEIAQLLNDLGTKLIEKGFLRDNFESVNASSSAPLELTAEELGALWNYQYVREDQSFGIHNYKYIKTLLENSIAALN
jgi:formate-dependent nitrite reductase cytochrome c552 subunit